MPKGDCGPLEAREKSMKDAFLAIWFVVMLVIALPILYFLGYCQGYANGKNIIYENYTVTERTPPISLGSAPRR